MRCSEGQLQAPSKCNAASMDTSELRHRCIQDLVLAERCVPNCKCCGVSASVRIRVRLDVQFQLQEDIISHFAAGYLCS
jgi:hypothetical protein